MRALPLCFWIAAGAATVGLATSLPLRAESTKSRATEEAAVREMVQRYVAAREAQDPRAIEALFTRDADQLVSDGVWRRGREELVAGMLQSSKRSGGTRTIEVKTVRFLAPTVAVADGVYRQTGLAAGTSRDMWTTLMLTREGKGWRIAGIRNMLPAAPAPPAAKEGDPKPPK
ncbi:MAG: hypothetical protein K0Q72_1692 [Armatimonadetes bacterium]|nr:hypothetical protein [Armatimonadota bacterium]